MEIVKKSDFERLIHIYLKQISLGGVFIYPTDTIYGIGCDATDKNAIIKIRKIKKRTDQPFSVIVPSVKWIDDNCDVKNKKFLQKLPGPYTFVVELKNIDSVSDALAPGKNSIGIRMPKHWISSVAKKLGKPIVTTSVNLSGEPHIKSLKDISKNIAQKVDFAIDEGVLEGYPSEIYDLTGEEPKRLR